MQEIILEFISAKSNSTSFIKMNSMEYPGNGNLSIISHQEKQSVLEI